MLPSNSATNISFSAYLHLLQTEMHQFAVHLHTGNNKDIIVTAALLPVMFCLISPVLWSCAMSDQIFP